MAKKKAEASKEPAGPNIWDIIVDSVNEENKELVLGHLQNGLEFLESTGDKEMAKKVAAAIKKINQERECPIKKQWQQYMSKKELLN